MIVDKHKIYLKMARDYSQMSKCRKIKVGCVIVNNGRIVSTGVNGTPKGTCNCTDHFYAHNDEQFAKDHSIWSTEHEVHAEMNALLYAAKSNVEVTNECVLYCTHEPCNNCLKHIAVIGIKQIYYIEKYYNNTVDNKYKINITQLDIDENQTQTVAYELMPTVPITSKSDHSLLFDVQHLKVSDKLKYFIDTEIQMKNELMKELTKSKFQPTNFILNARKKIHETGFISFNEIVNIEFGNVKNPELYKVNFEYNDDIRRELLPGETLPIENNNTIIWCTGSTPVHEQ